MKIHQSAPFGTTPKTQDEVLLNSIRNYIRNPQDYYVSTTELALEKISAHRIQATEPLERKIKELEIDKANLADARLSYIACLDKERKEWNEERVRFETALTTEREYVKILLEESNDDIDDINDLSNQIAERDTLMVKVYERLKYLANSEDESDTYVLVDVLVQRLQAQLKELGEAAIEFRRHAHYPHGVTSAGDDSVNDEKKLMFIAGNNRLTAALAAAKI